MIDGHVYSFKVKDESRGEETADEKKPKRANETEGAGSRRKGR